MTILIGVKKKNSVLFVSDMLRNIINADGSYGGEETQTAQKIRMIRKSGIIATAGIGTQGESAARQIQSSIQYGDKRSSNQLTECCTDVLRFSRDNFIKYNPDASYSNLAALIGGIDEQTDKPYLYLTHSDLGFSLIPKDISCIGVNNIAAKIEPQIIEYNKQNPNSDFVSSAKAYSSILRKAAKGSIDVGQRTFIIELTSESISRPTCWFINENGIGMETPENYVF